MNKKYLKIAAIAFVVWYLVTSPQSAAATVNSALAGLGHAAESASTFMSHLRTS